MTQSGHLLTLHLCSLNRYHPSKLSGANMRRREFIGLVSAAAVWPISAYAQEKIALIGFLLIGDAEPMGPVFKSLRDLGYVEGHNAQFVVRTAQGDPTRLPELAKDLVANKVDIIVASLKPS